MTGAGGMDELDADTLIRSMSISSYSSSKPSSDYYNAKSQSGGSLAHQGQGGRKGMHGQATMEPVVEQLLPPAPPVGLLSLSC